MVHEIKSSKKIRKASYKIRNWSEYNQALVNRGNITFWINDQAIDNWLIVALSGKVGAPKVFTDMAIEICLTVREVFHLDFRKTEGFIASIFALHNLALRISDYSTVSKRAVNLPVMLEFAKKKAKKITDIVVDASGVKVYGEGEWKVRTHGKSKHRTWRKIHIAIDPETGDITAHKTTTNDIADSEILPELFESMPQQIDNCYTDGAYDKRACYDFLQSRGVNPVIPPRRGARIWHHGNSRYKRHIRDKNIRMIRKIGRKAWKKAIGYHTRSLVETTFFRLKTLFSDKAKVRNFSSQSVILAIRCNVLNKINTLGMPDSYLVA